MPTRPRIARLMCRLSNSPPAYWRSIGKLKERMPSVSRRVTRMADDQSTHSRRSMRRIPTLMLLCEGSAILTHPQYVWVLHRPQNVGSVLTFMRKSTDLRGERCNLLIEVLLVDSRDRKSSQKAHGACVIRKPLFVLAEAN